MLFEPRSKGMGAPAASCGRPRGPSIEFVLQSGEFFCVGDNPGQSEDSRSANIGPVKESDIVGKAWFHSSSEEDGMGLIK